MKAGYAAELREADRRAEEEYGISGIVLMENAAIACVTELIAEFHEIGGKKIAVFCGKGNNGGDGFAIARHLINAGADVTVLLVCGDEFSGDAKTNYDILVNLGAEPVSLSDYPDLLGGLESYDIIIDAIFGTGIHGEISGLPREAIEAINNCSAFTFAVDIPSGLNADSGEICGVCVKADETVTFVAYKVGMLLFPGAGYVGKTTVHDISMPASITDDFKINIIDKKFVEEHFPQRTENSHKGDYGKLLIIAGSRGMTGAAFMASSAALRSGCGMVTIGVCESLNDIFEDKTCEVLTIPLPDVNGHFASRAVEKLAKILGNYDSILIGPGIGTSDDAAEVVKYVLLHSDVSVTVDADAINIVSGNMSVIKDSTCNLIFTPHSVEMSRLTGKLPADIEENRLRSSADFCERYGATLILKGHHTIVTSSDLKQYINTTGNSGLAKAGSGDVLAGITVSLTARGAEESIAAAMAVYLHGRAADMAAEKLGEDSLTATDVIEYLPYAIKEITDSRNKRI